MALDGHARHEVTDLPLAEPTANCSKINVTASTVRRVDKDVRIDSDTEHVPLPAIRVELIELTPSADLPHRED